MTKETPTQKLFRMWYGPLTNAEIAEELGVSLSKLGALARQHKLKPRNTPAPVDNENPRPGEPDQHEILQTLAEIQAGWSEEERLRRYQGKRRVAYIVPKYEFDGRVAAFTSID